MKESHFDQPLQKWTARKHAILKRYLPTFCTALSRKFSQQGIYYIDGYAGAGIYKDKSNPQNQGAAGSPVIAAEETQKLNCKVTCINVEEKQKNFLSLQEATKIYPHIINLHADFNDALPQIIPMVSNSPAFFFLDPFGTKDLPMEGLIDQIAMRRKPTDILSRYATETVRRLAGAYEKDVVRGTAHGQTLDRWFRGNKWRSIIQQYPAGPQRDEQLLQYYLDQLVSISGGRLEFASSYPIMDVDETLKYHLIFATGDRLGIKLMSDILYSVDTIFTQENADYKKEQEDKKNRGQLSMDVFSSNTQTIEEKYHNHIQAIKNAIAEVGKTGKKEWEFDALRGELIITHGWFAQFSEKEFRAACKALYSEGKIQRISPGNGWSKGTIFDLIP